MSSKELFITFDIRSNLILNAFMAVPSILNLNEREEKDEEEEK